MNSSDTKSTSDIRDFFVKRKRSDEVENSSAGLNKASSEDNSFETDPSSPVKKKLKMSNSAYKPKPKRFKQNEDVFRVRMASDASTDSEITFNKSNTTEVSRNMGPQEFSDESDSDDAIKPKSTKKPEDSEKSESSENESDEEEYEVEAILDYKWCLATVIFSDFFRALVSRDFLFFQTQGLYFVKWLGWDDSQNTWEPLSNLTTCDEKLRQFYTKRVADREAAPSAKKRYFEVPPDPRTNFERRSELADRICPPPCQSELEAFYDRLKTHPVKQWKQEVINKCFDQLEKSKGANEKKKTMVREQIMLKHVLGKRKEQQQRLKEWEKEINAISGDVAKITVENEADLEGPPRQLNFIRESKPSEGIIIPDDPLIGCDCQNCDIKADKDCCPSMNGVVHFPYTKYGKLRIAVGVPIYECNKLCKCDASCANRVVQKGRKVRQNLNAYFIGFNSFFSVCRSNYVFIALTTDADGESKLWKILEKDRLSSNMLAKL